MCLDQLAPTAHPRAGPVSLTRSGPILGGCSSPYSGGNPEYLSSDGKGDLTTSTSPSQTVTCTARFQPWGTPIDTSSPTQA